MQRAHRDHACRSGRHRACRRSSATRASGAAVPTVGASALFFTWIANGSFVAVASLDRPRCLRCRRPVEPRRRRGPWGGRRVERASARTASSASSPAARTAPSPRRPMRTLSWREQREREALRPARRVEVARQHDRERSVKLSSRWSWSRAFPVVPLLLIVAATARTGEHGDDRPRRRGDRARDASTYPACPERALRIG